jgi:predicted ATPase/DNA-binding SARP family transcriptional activator
MAANGGGARLRHGYLRQPVRYLGTRRKRMTKFAILGPIELFHGGRPRPIGGPRQLALLAFLLVHANRAVSTDRLIDALWTDEDSRGALKRLHVAVTRLRKALATPGDRSEPRLRTTAGGYLLAVAPGELDADLFQTRIEDARRRLEDDVPTRAAELLRDALELWRGPPLAEVAYHSFAQDEIRRLEELHLTALEYRAEADLRLGRHTELIGELEALVAAHPERERLAGQLMLALYRGGRQAEALNAYTRTRTHLSTALGLSPGPALQALQAQILEQSPALELVSRENVAVAGRPPPGAQLPAPSPRLLGRDADVEAVIALLFRDDVRLVTLTGIGGVGKTSLAIAVAHRAAREFRDGATLVELASLSDPGRVPDAVLRALGGAAEAGATALETLRRLIAGREQLVVLDNLEHLLAAAPLLSDLLDTAPRVKLLATSRAALDLRAEHRYPVAPLGLPDSREPTAVAGAPATALFISRALARDPAFQLTTGGAEAIARVCARVGGLPLAIELAAARTSALSPQELARRLGRVLPALAPGPRDAPLRQRTLRATLDWSYELLDQDERIAFARLAVFAGGCTTDAAEHVTGAALDTIDGLIAKSLLTREPAANGEGRLAMLEPLREYAAERLHAHTDEGEVVERHSRYYIALAEAARSGLRGSEQREWRRRLDAEADNLRSVLTGAREAGDGERLLRLGAALEFWWSDRLLWSEGRAWIESGLSAASRDVAPHLRAEALLVCAWLSGRLLDFHHARECGREALRLHRTLGQPAGISRSSAVLALVHHALGDRESTQTAAADAVRTAHDADPWTLAAALAAKANVEPDLAAAQRLTDEAALLFDQLGDSRALAWLWRNLGSAALDAGETHAAGRCFARALDHTNELDDPLQSILTRRNHALVAVENRHDEPAAASFAQVLAGCRTYGLRRPVCRALTGLAAIAARARDAERAAELVGASSALRFGQPLDRVEERLLVSAVEPARRHDRQDAWDSAHARGRRLSLEAAIDLGIQTARRYAGKTALRASDQVEAGRFASSVGPDDARG